MFLFFFFKILYEMQREIERKRKIETETERENGVHFLNGHSRGQELHPDIPCEWHENGVGQVSTEQCHLDYLLLPSQVHCQGARWEAVQPRLSLVLIWVAGITGSSFTCHIPILVLGGSLSNINCTVLSNSIHI